MRPNSRLIFGRSGLVPLIFAEGFNRAYRSGWRAVAPWPSRGGYWYVRCIDGILMSGVPADSGFGRVAFGENPGSYHATRPAYPAWVFEVLRERCHLVPGTATFEIGAGTGLATRPLLDLGANPLLAIEPDCRLAGYLRGSIPDSALSVTVSAFEDASLDPASFDLGVSATAFHWLDEDLALSKIAALLRPHGWWAMVWNVFGDNSRADPFHEATKALLPPPLSPSAGSRYPIRARCRGPDRGVAAIRRVRCNRISDNGLAHRARSRPNRRALRDLLQHQHTP